MNHQINRSNSARSNMVVHESSQNSSMVTSQTERLRSPTLNTAPPASNTATHQNLVTHPHISSSTSNIVTSSYPITHININDNDAMSVSYSQSQTACTDSQNTGLSGLSDSVSTNTCNIKNYTSNHILKEPQLSSKIKALIKCTRCNQISDDQIFQKFQSDDPGDNDLEITCGACMLRISDTAEVNKYIRNIAVEEVSREILKPVLSSEKSLNKLYKNSQDPKCKNSKNKKHKRMRSTSVNKIEENMSSSLSRTLDERLSSRNSVLRCVWF